MTNNDLTSWGVYTNVEVQFKSHQPKPPESVCSLPCEKGQAKKYVEGESCCWHCFNCSLYQVRHYIRTQHDWEQKKRENPNRRMVGIVKFENKIKFKEGKNGCMNEIVKCIPTKKRTWIGQYFHSKALEWYWITALTSGMKVDEKSNVYFLSHFIHIFQSLSFFLFYLTFLFYQCCGLRLRHFIWLFFVNFGFNASFSCIKWYSSHCIQ